MSPKLTAFILLVLVGTIEAQDVDTVRITHRFDWRRSVDSKYQGLVYGYMTGSWKMVPSANAGWTEVEARYYQASESRRNNAMFEKPVEAEKVARFRIDPNGAMSGFTGDGVPYYRNFPAPLPADAGPGSVWTGSGELVGDFLGSGTTTRVPILIEYRWEGPGTYGTTPVLNVKTQYALRYQSGRDPQGDPGLSRVDGSHVGVVSYDASTHKVVFIRETAKEQFTSSTGRIMGNEGILLTFFEGVPALGTSSMVKAIAQALKAPAAPPQPAAPTPAPTPSPAPPPTSSSEVPPPLDAGAALARLPSDAPDVRVEEDPRGVKLTLDKLKFVADQAIFLPGETKRLTAIADLLKTVPGRNILVVGHTAAVGSTESQDSLSIERALAVVDQLKKLGIPAQRLLYEGRGGTEPVAPNTTEAGKAQNRRVEIIILDQ